MGKRSTTRVPQHAAPAAAERSLPALDTGRWAAPAALAVLAAALGVVYAQVLDAPFFFDDRISIETNKSLRQLWPLWGDAAARGPLNPPRELPTAGRPVVNYSLAVNYWLGELNPRGYRLANVTIHGLSAVLVMLIVRRTLLMERFGGRFERAAGPLAFGTAFLWALHPLQTEAVAYATQRTELLVAMFYLATLYCALRYWAARSPRERGLCLALAVFACGAGMASKEVMVSAPVVVLFYEWTFVADSWRRVVRESWPLYAGLAATWIVLLVLNVGGPRSASAGFHLSVSARDWWFTQAQVFWMYLKLAIWPWPQIIHYELPYLTTWRAALPGLLATAAVAVGSLVLLWRRQPAGFVGAWVFAILAPTMVVPITSEVAAERRMYLPLAGLAALAVASAFVVLQEWQRRRAAGVASAASNRPWLVFGAAMLVLAAASAAVSANRLATYSSETRLWEDVLTHQPRNYVANYNLAVELTDTGHPQEALPLLERAIAEKPGVWKGHNRMGVALSRLERHEEALPYLERAVELNPAEFEARICLGATLTEVGRFNEALTQLEEAEQINAEDARLHFYTGLALSRAGDPASAALRYLQAVKLSPNYAAARNNLGVVLTELDRLDEALTQFQKAAEIDPDYSDAHKNIAVALARRGDTAGAIRHFEEVRRLAPDDFEVYPQLTELYVRTNQLQRAVATAERAVALAKSAGQTQVAEQIGAWLEQYRARLAGNDARQPAASAVRGAE